MFGVGKGYGAGETSELLVEGIDASQVDLVPAWHDLLFRQRSEYREALSKLSSEGAGPGEAVLSSAGDRAPERAWSLNLDVIAVGARWTGP